MNYTDEQVRARAEAAWDRARKWYALKSEAYYYAAPGIDPYVESGGEPMMLHGDRGQPQFDHVFDGTLVRDAEDLANEMVAELMPAGRHWAKLMPGPLMGEAEATPQIRNQAFQRITKTIFEAIHASNWYLTANMMALDCMVAGTGIARIAPGSDGTTLLQFEAVSQAHVALEGGAFNNVTGVHRKEWLTREEIAVKWPDASELEGSEPDPARPRRHTVQEYTWLDVDVPIWRYVVLATDTTGQGARFQRIVEREYAVSPWIVWRYALRAGEIWGRGPVFSALPGARTLNHSIQVRLEGASMRAVGAYTYRDDSVFNPSTAYLGSGSFLPVGSNDRTNPTIRALEPAGDPNLTELIVADERSELHKTMNRDDISALPRDRGVMSATEVMERQREMLRKRGGPYMRMSEEVGRPLLRAVAYHLGRAGLLPDLERMAPNVDEQGRPEPLKLDGSDVHVAFHSPLVMAQKISEAQTIVRWAQESQVAAGPQAFQNGAKTEDIPKVLAENYEVDAALVRSDEERQQLQQMAQEAMAAQAAQAQARPAQEAPA